MKNEDMVYEEIIHLNEKEENEYLSSNVPKKMCEAILSICMYGDDINRSQEICAHYVNSENFEVSRCAIIGLGHIVRINGYIDIDKALKAVSKFENDPNLSGYIENLRGDISMFYKGGRFN